MYGVLNRIRHTKQFIPNYIKRAIATALSDPIMDYGNVVTYGWGAHSTENQVHRDLVADNDKIKRIFSNQNVITILLNIASVCMD